MIGGNKSVMAGGVWWRWGPGDAERERPPRARPAPHRSPTSPPDRTRRRQVSADAADDSLIHRAARERSYTIYPIPSRFPAAPVDENYAPASSLVPTSPGRARCLDRVFPYLPSLCPHRRVSPLFSCRCCAELIESSPHSARTEEFRHCHQFLACGKRSLLPSLCPHRRVSPLIGAPYCSGGGDISPHSARTEEFRHRRRPRLSCGRHPTACPST
jgi:hypothetical protein